MLEERVGGQATQQSVYSPVYVDALVLRDRDTDGNGSLDERLWVQPDANWNVTSLVGTTGAVRERFTFDPYGSSQARDAAWNVKVSSDFMWVVRHQGLRLDLVTGYYYNRHREYSPTLGRFMQTDPLQFEANDINFYRYVGNDPLNGIDPTGLAELLAGITQKFPKRATPTLAYGNFIFGRYFALKFDKGESQNGVILQHVTTTAKINGCKDGSTSIPIQLSKDGKKKGSFDIAQADYWEAWSVNNGIISPLTNNSDMVRRLETLNIKLDLARNVHDYFAFVKGKDAIGTSGRVTFRGEAFFVSSTRCPKGTLSDNLGFKDFNNTGAGPLYSINTTDLTKAGQATLDGYKNNPDSNILVFTVDVTWENNGMTTYKLGNN